MQVYVAISNCMSFNKDEDYVVVGACVYGCFYTSLFAQYYTLPPNTSKFSMEMVYCAANALPFRRIPFSYNALAVETITITALSTLALVLYPLQHFSSL